MGRRLAAGAAALMFALVACTAEEPRDDASPGVIVPGRPGESAEVVAPEEADEHRQTVHPTATDVRYVTMMLPHHRQAITMTDLVPARARSERVKAIASRIAAAQEAEIAAMEDWLAEHDELAGGKHAHGLMPGMATEEQLAALRAADGAEFDRLFRRLMIAHHEGALTMAEEQLAGGVEPRALEMAQEVLTTQTDEIGHLRRMLGA